MKKKDIDMTPICEKCGKIAPIDNEMSTDNWTVYKVKDLCICGGRFVPRALLNDSEQ